jgi:predicted nucleic acid-binding protein
MFCLTEGIAENFTLDEDPDDEEFVRIALASSAEFIITGDNHLLNVNEDFPTRILRPSDFMGLWRSGQIEGGTDPTRRIRRTWKIW